MKGLHSDFVSLNMLWRIFIEAIKILDMSKRRHCQLLGMSVTVQCASDLKNNFRRPTLVCPSSISQFVKSLRARIFMCDHVS